MFFSNSCADGAMFLSLCSELCVWFVQPGVKQMCLYSYICIRSVCFDSVFVYPASITQDQEEVQLISLACTSTDPTMYAYIICVVLMSVAILALGLKPMLVQCNLLLFRPLVLACIFYMCCIPPGVFKACPRNEDRQPRNGNGPHAHNGTRSGCS